MSRRTAVPLVLLLIFQAGCAEVQSTVSRTQVPASVSLTPFLLYKGYYVNVYNASSSSLTNVSLTYYWADGREGPSQPVGVYSLGPGEVVTVDPSEVGWIVARHEKIAVRADGYLRKVMATNVLVDQL